MKSLYSTFVIYTLLAMIISGLFAFFLSNTYYQHFLKSKNDEKYTQVALEIADYIEAENQLNLHVHLEHLARIGYQINLVNEDGTSDFFGRPFRNKEMNQAHINHVLAGQVFHGISMFPKETFVTGFFANELENSIGVPVQYRGDTYALFIRPDIVLHFNEMRILFAWLLGLTIVFSLVFELILAKYLIRPLTKLNEATRKIRKGLFSFSFDFKRKDEIGELARSFQDMTTELAKLDQMRNEFISNVTHDFQSPLSTINGYTELLNDPSLPQSERDEYVAIIKEEAARLSNLTSQLLTLSTLNQFTTIQDEREDFSISEQIKSLIKKYRWQLFDKEISLQYSLPEIKYNGNPSLLLSVWDNLVSNAIKYNRQGGEIFISLEENEKELKIDIKDSGIGLTAEQQEYIFERFYRADTSRSKDIAGTGLGLAIVSKVVNLHHGEINVKSEVGVGTHIIVRLPKEM